MALEIVATACGILGKAVAEPVKSAVMRRTAVVATLKRLHLDPNQPPRDFESLYAYALVEQLYGQPVPVLALFRDEYVQQAFKRSFDSDDWVHLRREIDLAVERNRETSEFGHFGVDIDSTADSFVSKFQELVSRSRVAYETRVENKVDDVREMLEQVLKTRNDEEELRLAEEPGRAKSSPAERLMADASAWFSAVGYTIDKSCSSRPGSAALIVNVPTRRPGRFDRVCVLCVEGELGLHHLEELDRLIDEEAAAEGWGVAQLRVSEAARRKAEASEDRVSCFSFDELIDLEVNFEPYIESLLETVASREIDTRYVPLSCRKEEIDPDTDKPLDVSNYDWKKGGLDKYVEAWLTDPTKKHLSLLGEFGMGKSWFSLHFASKMAHAWKDAKAQGLPRPRVPLVIPLRDYAKQTSVAALISEFFFNKHQTGLRSYDAFRILNRMGRLLLIFDGFDEMASRIDRNVMVANFWELAKAVEPGAKVLLSSRTEHFPESKEARALFEARVSASASNRPTDGPTFEIVELVPFDDEQIKMMLGNVLSTDKVALVMANEDVRDLMRRPVMSELVIDALPEIERGAPMDLTRIYLYAIQRKMDRDVSSERTFTSRADKLFFLSEVAWEMLSTNNLSLNYRDFPSKLRACFGPVVESRRDLDYWEQDMRSQGMLVRNANGDYGPSHKSLLEFLAAYKITAELGLLAGDYLALIPGAGQSNDAVYSWSSYFASRDQEGSLPPLKEFTSESVERLVETFGSLEFNPVVYDFLASMLSEHSTVREKLIEHVQSTRGLTEAGVLGGNCANILGYMNGTLANADLRGCDLAGFRNEDIPQPLMSLASADLRDASLKNANLAALDKTGAKFLGAALQGTKILDSSLQPRMTAVHEDGSVTALVVRSLEDGRTVGERVVHWPTGELDGRRSEFALDLESNRPRGKWWRVGSVFDSFERGSWGYSSAGATFIYSPQGQLLKQLPVSVVQKIVWGGRKAYVVDAEGRTFDWRVVDAEDASPLKSIPPFRPEGADSFTYYVLDSEIRILARSDSWSRLFSISCESGDWGEVDSLSVGTNDSISDGRRPIPQIFANEENVFMARKGVFASFQRAAAEPALADLAKASVSTFVPNRDSIVLGDGRIISLWDTGGEEWERIWKITLGSELMSVGVSPDGSKVLVSCSSGELSIFAVSSGKLLSRETFNPHLRGALFNSLCGLDESEIASVRLAGGVFERPL
ncbi:NACHT domain-containing protein [Streptomyces tendae]|uniref:NACHT domain-containing protein n=1 Tax=Streptomyces tendae TaxID=1932 RepID=UPI0038253B6C